MFSHVALADEISTKPRTPASCSYTPGPSPFVHFQCEFSNYVFNNSTSEIYICTSRIKLDINPTTQTLSNKTLSAICKQQPRTAATGSYSLTTFLSAATGPIKQDFSADAYVIAKTNSLSVDVCFELYGVPLNQSTYFECQTATFN
jgi:hypothetical protein